MWRSDVPFFSPENAKLATVQNVIVDLPVKSVRVFYLPPSLSPKDALEMVQWVISDRDISRVGMLKGTESPETSFNESTWYYGVIKVGQKRYIIIVTVTENDRTIRIFSTCDDDAGGTGFLADGGHLFEACFSSLESMNPSDIFANWSAKNVVQP